MKKSQNWNDGWKDYEYHLGLRKTSPFPKPQDGDKMKLRLGHLKTLARYAPKAVKILKRLKRAKQQKPAPCETSKPSANRPPPDSAARSMPATSETAYSMGIPRWENLLKDDTVNIDHLCVEIHMYLHTIDIICKTAMGIPLTITSGNDSGHAPNSLHYKDQAIDIRTRYGRPNYHKIHPDKVQFCAEQLRSVNSEWDVVVEDDHIHLEWDPR